MIIIKLIKMYAYFKIIVFQVILTLIVIYLSKKLKLLDIPNSRKLHIGNIPYTGGIIISLTYLYLVFSTIFT